jgi:hypothetical protein
MFKTPYHTTVCLQYHLAPIISGLRLAKIEGQTITAKTSSGKQYSGIQMLLPSVNTIAPFTQPLDVDGIWYIDARAFLTIDREDNIKVTAPNELDFLILRAILSKQWSDGDQQGLSIIQDFPLRIYTRFLSEALVRRLGLDPLEQMKLAVLSGFFYLSQFETDLKLNDRNKTSFAIRISRATSIGTDKVLSILDEMHNFGDELVGCSLEDFCHDAKRVLTSIRANQINPGIIIASISGSWYGANSRETVAAALEYPPFFNALIYSALSDRSYHGSYFAKLVAQIDRNNNALGYQRALVDYIGASRN